MRGGRGAPRERGHAQLLAAGDDRDAHILPSLQRPSERGSYDIEGVESAPIVAADVRPIPESNEGAAYCLAGGEGDSSGGDHMGAVGR